MTRVRLLIPPRVKDAIGDVRRARHPEEACGLLFGRVDAAGTVVVEMFVECENVLHSPSAFEIDPVEQYKHLTTHEGKEMVGILHTHPGCQFVSSTDERFMRGISKVSTACWVIAGAAKGEDGIEIGAYRLVEGNIVRVPVDDTET